METSFTGKKNQVQSYMYITFQLFNTVPSYHFDNILHYSIFNRYVPKDNPKSQVFNVPWVRVDVSKIFIIIVISSD